MYTKANRRDGMDVINFAETVELETHGDHDITVIATDFGIRIVKSNSATQSEHIVEINFRDMKLAEQWRNV